MIPFFPVSFRKAIFSFFLFKATFKSRNFIPYFKGKDPKIHEISQLKLINSHHYCVRLSANTYQSFTDNPLGWPSSLPLGRRG